MEYAYSLENLRKTLETAKGKAFAENVKKYYEENYANKPLTVLSYAKYKLIHTTGERTPYQEEYHDRRNRLYLLQILSVYDNAYISDLEDLISAICEEYSWVLPAHNAREFGRFDYTEIDLASAESAFYLSETVYVLKDLLSSDIKKRVHTRIYERIVENFESREFVFDNLGNNWCSVCGGGVGVAYLYAFPESFERVKDRVFGLMEKYLLSIGEDGYCIEGTGYWQYGFGAFALFFDVYVNMTGEYPEILKSKKVVNTINFLTNAYLGGNKYLPYGDGGAQTFSGNVEIFSGIKNLFKDKFVMPKMLDGNYLDDMIAGKMLATPKKGLGFRAINAINLFGEETSEEKFGFKYFDSAEVVFYRGEKYSFTARCGNNYESHSHNDVGTFEIVKDDKRLLADLGAGEYTWAYFNDYNARYGDEIFVCGSQSHNLPIIDGQRQMELEGHYGKVLSVSDNQFKMDIAKAYENVINEMFVDYVWGDDFVSVTYEYDDQAEHQVTYRFISDYEPVVKDGKVIIENSVEIVCDKNLPLKVSSKEYKISLGAKRTAYVLDYIADGTKKDKVNFKFSIL